MGIRFEVLLNGKRLCLIGHDGFGVLSAIVSWCKRNPAKRPAGSDWMPDTWSAEELKLSLGVLDSNDPTSSRDLGWLDREGPLPIRRGDEIIIRVLDDGEFDKPIYVSPSVQDKT